MNAHRTHALPAAPAGAPSTRTPVGPGTVPAGAAWRRAESRQLFVEEPGEFRALPWLARAAAAQLLRHTDRSGLIGVTFGGRADARPLHEIIGHRYGASRADRELLAGALPLLEQGGWVRREGDALRVALPEPERDACAPFAYVYTHELPSFGRLRWFARAAAAQLLKLCDDEGRLVLMSGSDRVADALTRTLQRLAAAQRHERHAIARLIDALLEEIVDRFGKLPAQGQTLFDTHRLRVLAKPYGVAKIDANNAAIAAAGDRDINT